MYLGNNNIDIYTKLVNAMWLDEKIEIQKALLSEFAKSLRVCNADYLIKVKAFPVFNNQILVDALESIGCNDLIATGLYYPNGRCIFLNRLVIPIYGFDNKVHGFVGYDNGNECKNDEERFKLIPYLYLEDQFFKKERYWFMSGDEYQAALNKQYICIVDGIFDKITLQALGNPTASLLGSSLSRYHRDYLRYIKHWIVFSDADLAGTQLFQTCRRFNPNTIQIRVGNGAKDIDESLRSNSKAGVILNRLFNTLEEERYFFSHNLAEFE